MAGHHRHHFVPQFYFRLFADGKKHICVYLPDKDQIVFQAPIKGQCAKNEFYGSIDIEKQFSQLEYSHATVLQSLVKAACNERIKAIFREDFFCLLQAIMFQRARTVLEIEKQLPALEAMALKMFSDYVRNKMSSSDFVKFERAVELGQVRIKENPTSSVLRQITCAMEVVYLLSDMELRLVRNITDLPFVFSDSPVVFYNMLLKNVTERGVLGLQRPGLMIFYPLSTTLQLILFDASVYRGRISSETVIEIFDRADVSNLNALQLHHCKSSLYFRSPRDSAYVQELYRSHAPLIKRPRNEFRLRKDLLVNGESVTREGFQMLEPQLNHDLSLTFLQCDFLRKEEEHLFRYRNKSLVEEHKRLYPVSRKKRS